MARIRSVHPDICTDEVLAGLSGDVERCYVRLWTHLDDEGRCVDNPLLIKAALFPLVETISPKDVDWWLSELARAGLIRRYGVDDRRYLTAKPEAWARWQKPRRKVDSKLPAPPCADIVGTPRDIGPQCPPVGGGGEGGETETKKEGESEGEPEHGTVVGLSVDNRIDPAHADKIRELKEQFKPHLVALSPSMDPDSGFVEGQRASSSVPTQAAYGLPIHADGPTTKGATT